MNLNAKVLEFPVQPVRRNYGRTMDATFLNSVANHPEVRPWLGGVGPIDLSPLLADPTNVGMQYEYGGFVGHKLESGIYECHSMFLPEGRGEFAHAAMVAGLRYLFTKTDCMEVVTKAPDGNKAAFGAARAMGFATAFHLDKGWVDDKGERAGVTMMKLLFSKWVEKDPEVESFGRWFHERLEELTDNKIPVHYDEPAHNRAVGASVMMFRAGNPIKAVTTYNQWAKFAQFPGIKMLAINPVILDMDQVIVELTTDDMEVLKCR